MYFVIPPPYRLHIKQGVFYLNSNDQSRYLLSFMNLIKWFQMQSLVKLSLHLGDMICLVSWQNKSFYIFKAVDHLKNESLWLLKLTSGHNRCLWVHMQYHSFSREMVELQYKSSQLSELPPPPLLHDSQIEAFNSYTYLPPPFRRHKRKETLNFIAVTSPNYAKTCV